MPNPPLPTPEQLEAWGALCEQATSGEWTHETSVRLSSIGVVRPHFWTGRTPDGVHHFVHFRDPDNYADAAADAEFIATARTALPSLLAAYRALREELEWAKAVNAELLPYQRRAIEAEKRIAAMKWLEDRTADNEAASDRL